MIEITYDRAHYAYVCEVRNYGRDWSLKGSTKYDELYCDILGVLFTNKI